MTKSIRPLWLMTSPDNSGTATATRSMAAGMQRIGIAQEIYALRTGISATDFAQIGSVVKIFPYMGVFFLGSSATKAAASKKISLVHALSPEMLSRAERIARKLNVPLLVTANRLDEEEIRSISAFKGQGVVAVSGAIQERIVNVAGIARESIRIIHNGLDLIRLPRPSFAEPTTGQVWHTPVIGTFGHLSEKKGQRIFLQAVKLLVERGLEAEFVVLGDGPDRTALRNLATELNVTKRVTFTPQTVSGQLTQLDILVEPSLQEGLGMSVMQAMAMGVPVIATGVGGLYDLINDGMNGVMVPASDPQALSDAIWRLLKNPEERLEMARQARKMIEKEFSAETVAQELAAFYQECINSFQGWKARGRLE